MKEFKTVFFWIVTFTILFLLWTKFAQFKQPKVIKFSKMVSLIKAKKIRNVKIYPDYIIAYDNMGNKYKANINLFAYNDENQKLLNQYNVEYEYISENKFWANIFFSLGPVILLVFLWFIVMKQFHGGNSKAFSFGKSRARLVSDSEKRITFKDVAGCEEAKEELAEIVDFLKNHKKYTKLGAKIPHGVLLCGPPGTGKTLLAKAVAGEARVPFFSISGSDFVEMFVGVGASRVRDLFSTAKKHSPCVIFIDEIDAVGRQRFAGIGGGHDEREQTLNQLLVEMDGFSPKEGIIVIAATNRPDVLDPALLRPGRFDRRIIVDLPDIRGREEIFKVHLKKIKYDKDNVDPKILARGTPGFTGADIANVVNEAALIAARKNKSMVTMEDLEEAKDKVLMGPERRSMVLTEEEKRNTAVHESGHTLVAMSLPNSDPIHKVTIIPRGRALGITAYLPQTDKKNYTRSYLLTQVKILLGGRAAEEIVFNEISTGASNDLKRATEIVHNMICIWGMSKRLGLRTFGQEGEVFLGRDLVRQKDFSEETAAIIDQEIKEIIDDAYREVINILTQKKDLLLKLADYLMERETLTGEEVKKIINGEELKPIEISKEKTFSTDIEKEAEETTDKVEISKKDENEKENA